ADAVSIPAVCDADTGFGEAVNVGRAVREFERAGVAGIHIEDQEFPKKCGHLSGKRLIATEAMVEKIQAALAARTDPDFLLIARTDARGVTGMSDAIARAQRYVEAGADAVFPEALHSAEEFALFVQEVAPAFSTQRAPLFLANMTEFGKSPYLTVQQFAEMGYRLVIFPLTNFRVMLKAVQDALQQLKRAGTQQGFLDKMMTRKELYELLRYEG
ncbi:MAG: isocitrate lyase/phosphoenolpyruvate mutase family protein, partial [Abditibacteriales bacterium]|nr:isocitrate lyase/phosphoenolpyruvate mutase family protein [Abditibacteriales bacterium]MDW8367914.1 isocitrate lyase/phosphoenolpyruvate mutase family protein [Abditibacteriales bacterium]